MTSLNEFLATLNAHVDFAVCFLSSSVSICTSVTYVGRSIEIYYAYMTISTTPASVTPTLQIDCCSYSQEYVCSHSFSAIAKSMPPPLRNNNVKESRASHDSLSYSDVYIAYSEIAITCKWCLGVLLHSYTHTRTLHKLSISTAQGGKGTFNSLSRAASHLYELC